MSRTRVPIHEEIKQRAPFPTRAAEGAVALLRTADLLRRRLSAVIEPHGLTLQQYNVLRILRGAGLEGLPTLEVAERMIEKAPGVTRLVDRLEEAGLVTRSRTASDRRQVLCAVTRPGLELLAALDGPVRAADDFLDVLPPADLDHLIRLLDAVRAGCRSRSEIQRPRPDGIGHETPGRKKPGEKR